MCLRNDIGAFNTGLPAGSSAAAARASRMGTSIPNQQLLDISPNGFECFVQRHVPVLRDAAVDDDREGDPAAVLLAQNPAIPQTECGSSIVPVFSAMRSCQPALPLRRKMNGLCRGTTRPP